MNKQDFILEVQDILLVEESLNEDSVIIIDSMANLLLIAFLDDSFGKTVDSETIGKVNTVSDLIEIVGVENLN